MAYQRAKHDIQRWIGVVGALSSGLAILSSLLVVMIPQVPMLGIGRPIGILANIVVGFALGIIMLRWKESEPLAAA
jgi:tetrahydromethanopterin S-methyltransferase subunit G